MSKYVKIASIQFKPELVKESGGPGARERVLADLADTLNSLKGYGLNLIATSECVGYFAQSIEQAETIASPGPLLKLYQSFAASEKCHVAGSVKLRENDKVYNSIVFIDACGQILGHYDKTFLISAEIKDGVQPGNGPVVVDTEIGRLGGAVCFDLNFTGLMNSYKQHHPDIMVFSSMYHGGLMQAQWAYQLRSFFVSSLPRFGCGIIDPFGRPVKLTDCYSPVARVTVNLDRVMVHLDRNQQRFSDIEKKYGDEVIVDIPPDIGPALIYSMVPDRTAMDIASEFELILLDDYMAEAIAENAEKRIFKLTYGSVKSVMKEDWDR